MEKDDVVILTRNAILALDLADAVSALGLKARQGLDEAEAAGAVVVDVEELSRDQLAALEKLAAQKTPLILIGDDTSLRQELAASAVAKFDKPTMAEDVASRLGAVLKNRLRGSAPRICLLGPRVIS